VTEDLQDGRQRDRVDTLWQLFAAEDALRATRRDDPDWQPRSDEVRLLSERVFGKDLEFALDDAGSDG
jgi:hypothetical protein